MVLQAEFSVQSAASRSEARKLVQGMEQVPSLALVDLNVGDVDIGLRFGKGSYDGCVSVHLMDDYLTPMCAPQFLAGSNPLKTPADLAKQPLIYDDTHFGDVGVPNWDDWLKAAGLGNILEDKRGTHFDIANNALAAAIAGAGVLLGRTSLAENELRAGRLVTPFSLKLKSRFSFYAVFSENRAEDPNITRFVDWLHEEIGESASD